MKFKKLSAMLACAFVFMLPVQSTVNATDEMAVSAATVEETDGSTRATGLISTYTLKCTAGTKTVYITGATRGTEVLAKIGFTDIKVQRSSDKVNWTTEKTVSDKIAEDTDYKSLSNYPVSVEGGYYYRIVLNHYAKEDTFWFPDEQSVSNTSNSVWVP